MCGRAVSALAAAVLALAPLAAAGQGSGTEFPLGVASPILTLDQEAVFEVSAFGRRVASDVEAASLALSAENRRLEEELGAEELELTEIRGTVPPAEFRALADAFDARVEQIRREQEAKSRAILQFNEDERQRFLSVAYPLLAQLALEAGAVAVLDRRAVLIASERIDVTDRLVQLMDEVVGDGSDEAPDDLPVPSDPPDPDGQPPVAPPEGGPPLELQDAAPAE